MLQRIWRVALLIVGLALATAAAPTLRAQEGQPQLAGPAVTLFTRYPSQEIAIGDTVTFPLTLRTAGEPQLVRFDIQGLPESWTASFRGEGRVIQSAYVDSKEDTKVDLRVETPRYVQSGSYSFTVVARGAAEARLPIEIAVKDKAPAGLALSVDLPMLKGAPSTTFRYDARLGYDGDQNTTVNLLAETPPGIQVSFKLAGQDVTSIPISAGDTKNLSIEVKPFPDLAAGSYDVKVMAQGDQLQAETLLRAEVTGQPDLAISGPDARLSGQAQIGATTPFKLLVQNNGSAAARNIELSGSPPSGWSVTFEPQQIPELAAGQSLEVTANVKPADQAVAGDYQLSFAARPQDSPGTSVDFRITLLTSTLWGLVGVALIALAVLVVSGAVLRFGRR